jgi:antirestriction protein
MLKIFVNTWGNYNESGADGGEWITLPMDSDELEEVLENIADRMNDHDPEWAIHDSEWEAVELFEVSECDNIHKLNELLEDVENLEEYELQEIAAAIEAFGYEFSEAVSRQSRGCFQFYPGWTMEEVAEDLLESCYPTKDVPEFFFRYFDYEAFARDLSFDGYTETTYGVICDN